MTKLIVQDRVSGFWVVEFSRQIKQKVCYRDLAGPFETWSEARCWIDSSISTIRPLSKSTKQQQERPMIDFKSKKAKRQAKLKWEDTGPAILLGYDHHDHHEFKAKIAGGEYRIGVARELSFSKGITGCVSYVVDFIPKKKNADGALNYDARKTLYQNLKTGEEAKALAEAHYVGGSGRDAYDLLVEFSRWIAREREVYQHAGRDEDYLEGFRQHLFKLYKADPKKIRAMARGDLAWTYFPDGFPDDLF